MGGGKQTTTQSSTSEPWKPAQPALQTGLTDAQNLYKAGIGGQVNTQSNVTPFSTQSTQAMNAGQNMATANMNGLGLSGQYQDVINNGGFNQPQMNAIAGIQATASGNGYNAAQTNALDGIRDTANSTFNPFANEGFGSVLKQAQTAAGGAVNQAASGMGRFGGGAHQGTLAKSVADVTGQLVNNEWNNWNSRRDAAQNQMFNMGQQAQNNVFNANQSLFNAGQQGLGNMGSAYAGMQAPLTTLGNIGSAYEDLFTRLINDRNRIMDETQNKPWEQLGKLNAIASGAGSMGGSSSGTATTPGASPFGQIGGGLLALSGLFGG